MKNLTFLLLFLSTVLYAQPDCPNYSTTGTSSSSYITSSDPDCAICDEGDTGPWSGSACSGTLVSTATSPTTSLTLAYTAVNTDDFATISIDGGGVMTITGVNVGVAGDVIGPYLCGGSYGDVFVTIESTLPFTTVTLLNTGCSSGWVISCPGGESNAGNDSTAAVCDGTFTVSDLLSDDTGGSGVWIETTSSGAFDVISTEFDADVAGPGVYTFEYEVVVCGGDPDTSVFTITVEEPPVPNFEFIADGVSSEDGATGGCIVNAVQFNDMSTIPDPGTIVSWEWNFGDSGTSSEENPEHTYSTAGTYTVTLTVTSEGGCVSVYTKVIVMTNGLSMDIIFNEPTCFGYSDGSVTVNITGSTGELIFEIKGAADTLLNVENSNTANTLPTGWYYITVTDDSDCSGLDSIFIGQPEELAVELSITDPLCYGLETGYVIVDTVYNPTGDYDGISYLWTPNPGGNSGIGEDSTGNMRAGEYSLIINDQNGCTKTIDFIVGQPDSLYFAEFGTHPAYCRLYGYQNGQGVVFGAAAGGSGDKDYVWTNLDTEETSSFSTWGGINPGTYKFVATDANGCTIEKTVVLDSLNPIADFTVTSDQLNSDCQGTANVEVTFDNISSNFYNEYDPSADTTGLWNLDTLNASWTITHDFITPIDTIYMARGESYDATVCLTVTNSNGCSDTKCKIITIYEPIVFVPLNVFSPNGDNINDLFTFDFKAASISEFNCVIVNRWGVEVFELTSIEQGWDGTTKNGSLCKAGVYFYTYSAITDDRTALSGQGTVQIVR